MFDLNNSGVKSLLSRIWLNKGAILYPQLLGVVLRIWQSMMFENRPMDVWL
jgi:hypothetical protein